MKASQINIKQIEDWLNILISTYHDFPSHGLAKVINYYIERIIKSDDVEHDTLRSCQYHTMKRFWSWQSQQNRTL